MPTKRDLKYMAQRVVALRGQRSFLQRAQRWFWMLYHEFSRNEVQIRAQSLAFLTVFSLLPLIAGAFFIFTFLAQFGMVQDAILQGMESFLGTIPVEDRASIQDYIVHFKDAYLANLTHASGTVGIFALFVLIWVGLQVFDNLDSTLNYVWSSDRARPFFEKVRNFIVISVVAPIFLVAGFSIPLVLTRLAVTRFFLEKFTVLAVLLNDIIPPLLIFTTFLAMYRYVPVKRVGWRSAFRGALFATLSLEVVNLGMRFYFLLGTNSAYGKAAVVPLIGFWIYVLWIVVILGAEVSFLVQNEQEVFASPEDRRSLKHGRALLIILTELFRAFQSGNGAVSFEALGRRSGIGNAGLKRCLRYLIKQELVFEKWNSKTQESDGFALARDAKGISVKDLLEGFFEFGEESTDTAVEKLWRQSVGKWVSFFENTNIVDLAK